ncbi:GntR family transcriptional regulator [Kitasatospora herbaricolor]|uniref:GntR family transcriptional regulator n=1 Tax=Kitasatospora herbaricolor TaxID=68217 RepID=UPI00174D6980|nr:GntR family transcriptional regulator [Kitasatospora herbaricolor]MDQ0307957.1 DNA-binding GntR family transcriptional regulator [Kitasatospora herbaricolor]GGV39476.1 GntR family transcriptional regulator [Kitasatospora herbaricolor]
MTLVQGERAPYMQVADILRAEIASGVHQPGAKLPSVKKLAERFGIAEMTVHNGLRVLREEGLIAASPGRGTFVRSDLDPAALETGTPSLAGGDVRSQVENLASQVEQLVARVAELERRVVGSSVPD